MAEIEFAIVAPSGDTLPLGSDLDTDETYRLMRGVRGFGKTDVRVSFQASAGVGSRHLSSIADARTIVAPIETHGHDRTDTGEKLARLADALRTVEGKPPPKFTASFATGEVFELPFHYIKGAEDTYDDSDVQVRQVIEVRCPKPYWIARAAVQVSVQQPPAPGPLLPNLALMTLSSSTTVGDVEIVNQGNIEAPVSVRITGPGGPTRFDINGIGWVVNAVLTEGEIRTIDTATKQIRDGQGQRRYRELGSAPRFPMLPAGRSTAHISMDAASSGRWELTTDAQFTNRVPSTSLRVSRAGWSSWSDGHAAQSFASTGFGGTDAGYLQLGWSATSPAHAAILCEFDAAPGEIVSPTMTVLSSRAQIVQPVVSFFDAAGDLVFMVQGEPTEAPAGTQVRVGFAGSLIGKLPARVVRGVIAVGVVVNQSRPWQAGDTFRGSRASVTDTLEIEEFVDGTSKNSGWTGAPNASQSRRFRLARVGFSEVSLFYQPMREVMH